MGQVLLLVIGSVIPVTIKMVVPALVIPVEVQPQQPQRELQRVLDYIPLETCLGITTPQQLRAMPCVSGSVIRHLFSPEIPASALAASTCQEVLVLLIVLIFVALEEELVLHCQLMEQQ